MAKAVTPKKMCINCGKTKPISDFYPNRAWGAQQNCDLYCKKCVAAMVFDKDSLRKYMWENNRLFSEKMWEDAMTRARRVLANNAEYLNNATSQKRKEEIASQVVSKQALGMMNMIQYYHFNNNADEIGNLDPFDPKSKNGMLVKNSDGEDEALDTSKRWDSEWNGTYTPRELEYLNNYYNKLQDSFSLDDISAQDYARKVAKASLEADTRYELMRSGRCDSKAWREAQDLFDSLSKSSAFTAAQRKDRGSDNNKVLAEIIADIEINHHASMPKVTFPPDDIDRILEDFRHTEDAIK